MKANVWDTPGARSYLASLARIAHPATLRDVSEGMAKDGASYRLRELMDEFGIRREIAPPKPTLRERAHRAFSFLTRSR